MAANDELNALRNDLNKISKEYKDLVDKLDDGIYVNMLKLRIEHLTLKERDDLYTSNITFRHCELEN